MKCDGIVFHPLQLNDLNDFSERKTRSLTVFFRYGSPLSIFSITIFLEDFKLFRINHWLLLAFKKYFENGKKIVQLTCTVDIQSCLYGWNVKVFDRLKLLSFISTDGIFDRLVSLSGDILIINNECLVIWDQILSNLLIFHYLIEEI